MGKRNRGKKKKWSDHYTEKAKVEGYAARSVYKLEEIQRRFPLFRGGQRVVDLGCSPGSWAKYARQRIGKGTLVGVDINPPEYAGFDFILSDIREVSADQLRDALGGPANVLLSDMAPLTTGAKLLDHVQQLELAMAARDLALEVLEPGGHFVCKVFDGEDAHDFVMSVRPHFGKVKRVRPDAVRKQSREFFLVCLGFKGSSG